MKKHLLFIFTALLPLLASAQTKVEIGGIWYNLYDDTKQAEVTYQGRISSEYRDEYTGAVTIPATVAYEEVEYSVTKIGYTAFEYCANLTAVTIPESVTTIGEYAFASCGSLTSIKMPESISTIGKNAFASCSSLTSISIPEGVPSIGNYTFFNCSNLTAVNLPNSLTGIGSNAFNGCEKLASITCKAVTPPTCGSDAFSFVEKSIPLYVPTSAIAAYQAAEGWMDFTNIQAMPEVTVTGITLDQTTATLTEGETLALTATVAPDDATDKTVVWNTSDAEVATVDENGVVTAIAEGTATITATASGKEATCVVTVEKEQAGGESTGIEQVEAQGSTVVYDLMGRRVEKAEKGIYIVNGKKTVIK